MNRWAALAVIFVSFLQFTLNWFCIVPAFGDIAKDLNISFPQVGVVAGMFIVGYGLAHIPAGWLAERHGMRTAMLVGIATQTLGATMSAFAPSYELLLFGRLVCGVGGSIYIGSAIGLTAAWFRDGELATANGVIQGGAFTVGAAIGLFCWGTFVALLGWRMALLSGAGIGLLTFILVAAIFPAPRSSGDEVLHGEHLSKESLRRVFGNPLLWVMGMALLGGYGSYFSAIQLLPHYVQSALHADAGAGEKISVILLLSGIPGGFMGGWLADRIFGLRVAFFLACLTEAAMFALMPHLGLVGVELAAAAIGASLIAAFVPWVSIPGERTSGFMISDVPTAVGLMLSIVAIGGAVISPAFAKIATTLSFEAAWYFQAVITLGFAFLAFVSRKRTSDRSERSLAGRGDALAVKTRS